MKKSVVLAILSLVFVSNAVRAQAPARPAERVTVIRAGALIDGTGGAPRKNQLIFVRGQRIEKVADGSAQIPAGAAVVDLSSATVLPGLIDSHTHIFLWGEDPAKGGYDENILKAGIALRPARDLCMPARSGAGIHNAARFGNGGRRIRRHRDQASD